MIGNRPSGVSAAVDLPEQYLMLKNFLALEQWEQANQATNAIVLDLAGRSQDDWLWPEDFSKIPCHNLQLINQLWLNHSRGRFGFSVQQRIWQKAATLAEYEAECYVGEQVGWRRANGDWLTYDHITFDFSAPRGHLPLAFAWWVEGAGVVLGGVGKFWQIVKAQQDNAQSPAARLTPELLAPKLLAPETRMAETRVAIQTLSEPASRSALVAQPH